MDNVHDIGAVKYDFLILKTLQVIRDTCKYLGEPYPKTHEIDWEDENVWEDMLKSTAGIFQFEGKKFALVKPCERASGVTHLCG